MRIRLSFAAVLGAALALACGGGEGPTQAGDLFVSYYQGGPELGAALITINGGPVEEVTALGGQQVSFASPFAGTTKVVIAGDFTNGDVLRLRVPDVTQFAHYTITTEQAADKVSFALLQVGGYRFTVHR